MHQIGSDEARKCERAGDASLARVGDPEQEVGDQGHGELNAYGVLAGAKKLADFQRLLSPAEEQLQRVL
jgi:hypothetical protein